MEPTAKVRNLEEYARVLWRDDESLLDFYLSPIMNLDPRLKAFITIKEREALQSELGMDGDISLPTYRAKGGFRKDSRHYSEVLRPEDRAIIERVCHHEISVLGYRFEDA